MRENGTICPFGVCSPVALYFLRQNWTFSLYNVVILEARKAHFRGRRGQMVILGFPDSNKGIGYLPLEQKSLHTHTTFTVGELKLKLHTSVTQLLLWRNYFV